MGGGQGGSAGTDGVSALLWPTSAANTSIELFEQRVPVLVVEKTYVADSAGPGRSRGGLGQRVTLRKRRSIPKVSPSKPRACSAAAPAARRAASCAMQAARWPGIAAPASW